MKKFSYEIKYTRQQLSLENKLGKEGFYLEFILKIHYDNVNAKLIEIKYTRKQLSLENKLGKEGFYLEFILKIHCDNGIAKLIGL
jgi:uncharacterized protein YpbB